jgi:hypothetical protein
VLGIQRSGACLVLEQASSREWTIVIPIFWYVESYSTTRRVRSQFTFPSLSATAPSGFSFAQLRETYILGAQSAFEHGRDIGVADVIQAIELQAAGAQDLKTSISPRVSCGTPNRLPDE